MNSTWGWVLQPGDGFNLGNFRQMFSESSRLSSEINHVWPCRVALIPESLGNNLIPKLPLKLVSCVMHMTEFNGVINGVKEKDHSYTFWRVEGPMVMEIKFRDHCSNWVKVEGPFLQFPQTNICTGQLCLEGQKCQISIVKNSEKRWGIDNPLRKTIKKAIGLHCQAVSFALNWA